MFNGCKLELDVCEFVLLLFANSQKLTSFLLIFILCYQQMNNLFSGVGCWCIHAFRDVERSLAFFIMHLDVVIARKPPSCTILSPFLK